MMTEIKRQEEFFNQNKTKLKDMDNFSLAVIYQGLNENLDVTPLLKNGLSYEQRIELLIGLRLGLDVEVYNHKKYSIRLMREIRKMLEKGYSLSQLKSISDPEKAKIVLDIVRDNNDYFMILYPIENYDENRYLKGYELFKNNYDCQPIMNVNLVDNLIVDLVYISILNNLSVESIYNNHDYSPHQKRELILGLIEGLDVSKFSSPLFSSTQMRQIRIGLAFGLDVDYNDYNIPESEMTRRRKELMNESNTDINFNYDFIKQLTNYIPETGR